MTKHATTLLERLRLPHRVKLLAAGDTGFASAKTYDLETPRLASLLARVSSSARSLTSARRANIRYRPAPAKPRFVHTLNASGLAFPRVIAAIIEHYQQRDGSVTVPEVLRPYLGVDSIR
jgi:seryl-tRNA synthetase